MSLLNRGKSMSMSTRIPSGTPSIHPEQPPSPTIAQTSKSRFHCNHRTRHAGVVVDRHNASQSSHRLPAVLNPQGSAAASTCTMSHPYHTHPFPAASRSRFLNGLPLPHTDTGTGGTPPPPPPRKKSEKGKGGSRRLGAADCQGKCILTSCKGNMYLPRLRRRKLALCLVSLSPPRVSVVFASVGRSSSGPGLAFHFLGQNVCVRS